MWKAIIKWLDEVIPTRAHAIAFAVVYISALIVAFIPLVNLVGYESAALYGVLLGVLVTGLTVHAFRTGSVKPPLEMSRTGPPAKDFGRLALVHLCLALGPLAILVLNGLRVPNCDWTAGFAFWALIVGPAILLGQSAAWLAVTLAPDRGGAAYGIAFFFPVADAGALLHHLATQPPIVGHQWFLGYFGGSIYDEALAVPPSLMAYRAMHVLAIVAVVAAINAIYAFRCRRLAGWTVALALGSALVFSVAFAHRSHFGISIDRGQIAQELGGTVETEHFIIHYPENRRTLDRLDAMIDDHEFRYDQLRAYFGTDPVAQSGEKVRSFVYADRDSKGRLMGARHTMVAKLWLHEMHILWGGTGDYMLTHELAHIFTEPFGAGPLKLSMQRGIGVNMGLVEGIAVAAEWRAGELTLHEASAAMRQLGLAPDLRTILGASGFWSEASGNAYTAMGSFVRFLVDTHGIEAFKAAYPTGDFEGAYGVEVEALITQWERHVDAIALTDRQKAVAQHRYDRPSIFGRDCARALAEIRDSAQSAASRGAYGKARHEYERFLEDDASRPSVLRGYARVLADLGRMDEARAVVNAELDGNYSTIDGARFLELYGDIAWLDDDPSAAARSYEKGLELALPVAQQRSLEVKMRLADQGDDRGRAYFLERLSDGEAMHLVMQWRQRAPEDGLVAYLLGRRLWRAGSHGAAIPHLEDSRQGLDVEVLDAEAQLMLGQSYYFEGHFDASAAIWKKLADSPMTRYREAAGHWATRLEWARRNR